MRVNQIRVKNFRNIKKLEYNPKEGLNIILGKNAQGKTNILEAIYVLSGNSSFRTNTDKDLVNYDASGFSIRSKYKVIDKNINLFFDYSSDSGKILLLNNKKINRNHDDLLKVVLFTPDDLFLIKGSPSKRRYFLDFVLKQVNNDYCYYLDNFTKILKKRNLLIKNDQTNTKSFKIINEMFVEHASKLILLRLNFVTLFDEIANTIFSKINSDKNSLKFRYALSIPIDSEKVNLSILQDALSKQLQNNIALEIRKKSTVAGPHLDDLHIYLDNRLAKHFASQGQQRNIVITMKLAELYSFKKVIGYYPIFLLDEVLSELDNEKKQLLIDELNQGEYQSFLTSVNIDNLSLRKANVDYVENGCFIGKG